MITQLQLRNYQLAQTEASVKNGTVDVLKADLLSRVEAGEPIERGPLTAMIQVSKNRRFSAESLTGILGAAQVAHLKTLLPETESRSLKVGQVG